MRVDVCNRERTTNGVICPLHGDSSLQGSGTRVWADGSKFKGRYITRSHECGIIFGQSSEHITRPSTALGDFSKKKHNHDAEVFSRWESRAAKASSLGPTVIYTKGGSKDSLVMVRVCHGGSGNYGYFRIALFHHARRFSRAASQMTMNLDWMTISGDGILKLANGDVFTGAFRYVINLSLVLYYLISRKASGRMFR